jgi:site-specific recombinase XerD
MSDKLDNDQLTLLEASLIVSLRGMTVEKECTELAPAARDWEWFLSRFRATKRLKNCSEATLKQYEFAIGKLREYIPKNPQEIEGNDIKYFLAVYGEQESTTTKKKPSKTYINNLKNDLGSFFGWMYEEGYIGKDPVKAVPKIKVPKTIKKAYTGEDMERMKSAAKSERDMALIYFLDATGMRIGEAVSVDRSQINWEKRTVVVYGTKGKAERVVCFTEECAYRLKEYLKTRDDEEPALFVKEKAPHSRLTKSGAQYIIRTLGAELGIHSHPHRFRRTMITRCSKRGMPLQDIQMLAGHANAATTQIYIDMSKEAIIAEYDRCV